jgi:hypothetical protein
MRPHCTLAHRTPIKGNGREEKPLFAGLESPAIAHHELDAGTGFERFDVPERDSPTNSSPVHRKVLFSAKRKI